MLVLMFLLFVVLVGVLSLFRLYLFLSGGKSRKRNSHNDTRTTHPQQQETDTSTIVKKMFAEGEGEYVDYEEVPTEKET